MKRILFLFTSVALLAGCSSGRAPEIRAICLRDDIGNYIIKWETAPHTDGTMKLYVSDTPNSFDMSRPCSYADINDGRVTYITNDNITRKYFLLSFNDKYYRTVGARSVQMDSVQEPARHRWLLQRTREPYDWLGQDIPLGRAQGT
ncbi:membrane lipoprotein lipid attachment site-containing protein [Parabacteroides merdae]|nr:membrane lipoprotein lipid attachment site-containing protein [Parabacteroides merdae]